MNPPNTPPTTYLMSAAALVALICVTVLASLKAIDGPAAMQGILYIVGPFIGGAALNGAAAHFAHRPAATIVTPSAPPALSAGEKAARIAHLQAEIDGLKIGGAL